MQNKPCSFFYPAKNKKSIRKWAYDFCGEAILNYVCGISYMIKGDYLSANISFTSALKNYARALKIYPEITREYPLFEQYVFFAKNSHLDANQFLSMRS